MSLTDDTRGAAVAAAAAAKRKMVYARKEDQFLTRATRVEDTDAHVEQLIAREYVNARRHELLANAVVVSVAKGKKLDRRADDVAFEIFTSADVPAVDAVAAAPADGEAHVAFREFIDELSSVKRAQIEPLLNFWHEMSSRSSAIDVAARGDAEPYVVLDAELLTGLGYPRLTVNRHIALISEGSARIRLIPRHEVVGRASFEGKPVLNPLLFPSVKRDALMIPLYVLAYAFISSPHIIGRAFTGMIGEVVTRLLQREGERKSLIIAEQRVAIADRNTEILASRVTRAVVGAIVTRGDRNDEGELIVKLMYVAGSDDGSDDGSGETSYENWWRLSRCIGDERVALVVFIGAIDGVRLRDVCERAGLRTHDRRFREYATAEYRGERLAELAREIMIEASDAAVLFNGEIIGGATYTDLADSVAATNYERAGETRDIDKYIRARALAVASGDAYQNTSMRV